MTRSDFCTVDIRRDLYDEIKLEYYAMFEQRATSARTIKDYINEILENRWE